MLSETGKIAHEELANLSSHYSMVSVDQFVVMPNHVHILLTIDHDPERTGRLQTNNPIDQSIKTERASTFPTDSSIIRREGLPSIGSRDSERASPFPTDPSINETERASPFPTVSTIIGSYKSGVTNKIHRILPNMTVWQKSFYDHIIRDETDYFTICEYIEDNPVKWELDSLY